MYLLCCRLTCYYCFQDPNHLHDNVLETTASFLATGLDQTKYNFNQSSVSGPQSLLGF